LLATVFAPGERQFPNSETGIYCALLLDIKVADCTMLLWYKNAAISRVV
jgi:hypothetical protein